MVLVSGREPTPPSHFYSRALAHELSQLHSEEPKVRVLQALQRLAADGLVGEAALAMAEPHLRPDQEGGPYLEVG